MGGYEQIGMLIHSDHSCGETESYIEYYSQAVFDQFNDNSCIALNSVDKVIVLFSYSHDIIVNVVIVRLGYLYFNFHVSESLKVFLKLVKGLQQNSHFSYVFLA